MLSIICLIVELIKEFYDMYFKVEPPEYICKPAMQLYWEAEQERKNQQK